MELYQFITAVTFVYFFNVFNLLLLIFSSLMIRHFHKKYISEYKIKGTNKRLVTMWSYPLLIYNNIVSVEYNNYIFKLIFYCYDKLNKLYLSLLDEVIIMFTDLFYDVVNDHFEKNMKDQNRRKPNPQMINMFNKNPELINNMFTNMLDKMPALENRNKSVLNKSFLDKPLIDNTKILNDIKKFNNLCNTSPTDIADKKDNLQNNKLIDSDSENEDFEQINNIFPKMMNDDELNNILDDEISNYFNKDNINILKNNLQTMKNKINDIQTE
jgi:hypothetical protein